MEPDDLLLALDQGGTTSRAIAFDTAGRVQARASVEVATTNPAPDRVEQDAEELVRSLRRAVKDVAKHLGARADRIVAAGLATQRSSVACWDRTSGGALAPILSWQDRRAADRLEPVREHEAEVRALTGLRLSPHYGATKLAWCLDRVPEVRRAFQDGRLAFGPLASFLAFRLCDERPLVADAANAARTLLYDVRAGDWSAQLLDLFGVPRAALPRCVPTRGEVGTLDTGRRKVPLRVLTGDQSAALFAGGEPSPEVAYATFGTGAFVLRVGDTALGGTASGGTVPGGTAPGGPSLGGPSLGGTSLPNQTGLLTTLVDRTAERTLLALEGTVNGAGSALAWAAEELGVDAPATSLARWLESAQEPPLFLNGVGGLAAPFWVPDFASRFEGEGSPEARVVAVLESVVFLVHTILVEMARALGAPRVVRVGGGLSRLDGLCQRLASLSGIPVERAEQAETTALGIAVLLGATPPAAALQRFEPAAEPGLADRYRRWREVMP